jgi:predicted nucleotidyltransferase
MTVAEIKAKAISELMRLDNENILKDVLKYLEETNLRLQTDDIKTADTIFEAAVAQYDSVLKKLAE